MAKKRVEVEKASSLKDFLAKTKNGTFLSLSELAEEMRTFPSILEGEVLKLMKKDAVKCIWYRGEIYISARSKDMLWRMLTDSAERPIPDRKAPIPRVDPSGDGPRHIVSVMFFGQVCCDDPKCKDDARVRRRMAQVKQKAENEEAKFEGYILPPDEAIMKVRAVLGMPMWIGRVKKADDDFDIERYFIVNRFNDGFHGFLCESEDRAGSEDVMYG